MKEEYDFSEAERGKLYRPDAELNVPDHDVDTQVLEFVLRRQCQCLDLPRNLGSEGAKGAQIVNF